MDRRRPCRTVHGVQHRSCRSTTWSTPRAYLPNAVAAVTGRRPDLGRADLARQPPDAVHQQGHWCPSGRPTAPRCIEAAKANTGDGNYGLVFNQTESFWLVPFLGGFGGTVFAEDGITPTLNTEAMVNALTFLHGLKYTDQVMPAGGRLQRRRRHVQERRSGPRRSIRLPAWRRPRRLRRRVSPP